MGYYYIIIIITNMNVQFYNYLSTKVGNRGNMKIICNILQFQMHVKLTQHAKMEFAAFTVNGATLRL